MDWLHQAQIARQISTRHSQMKKLLVLSGFLHQKFAEKLKEIGQIIPDSARIYQIKIEPAIFSSGFVWHDFVWISGSWCSQGIRIPKSYLGSLGQKGSTTAFAPKHTIKCSRTRPIFQTHFEGVVEALAVCFQVEIDPFDDPFNGSLGFLRLVWIRQTSNDTPSKINMKISFVFHFNN